MPVASWIRLWGLRCRFPRHSRRFPSTAFAPTSVRERERAWIFPPVLSRFSSFSSFRFWLTGNRWFGIIACTVSKGTYIRSLARDIGRAAQSAAHIVSLRRSASGSISLADAIELENVSADTLRAHAIDPVSSLGLGRVDLPSEALARILNGQTISTSGSFSECLPEGSPRRPCGRRADARRMPA